MKAKCMYGTPISRIPTWLVNDTDMKSLLWVLLRDIGILLEQEDNLGKPRNCQPAIHSEPGHLATYGGTDFFDLFQHIAS